MVFHAFPNPPLWNRERPGVHLPETGRSARRRRRAHLALQLRVQVVYAILNTPPKKTLPQAGIFFFPGGSCAPPRPLRLGEETPPRPPILALGITRIECKRGTLRKWLPSPPTAPMLWRAWLPPATTVQKSSRPGVACLGKQGPQV